MHAKRTSSYPAWHDHPTTQSGEMGWTVGPRRAPESDTRALRSPIVTTQSPNVSYDDAFAILCMYDNPTNPSNISTHFDILELLVLHRNKIRTKNCTNTVHTLFDFKNYIARVYIFGKKTLKTVKSSYTETDNITSNL